jgi:hypothetical protein
MGLASAENAIAFFEDRLDVEAMINPEALRRV